MDLTPIFIAASIANGIPVGLLDSMCHVESGHNVRAYQKHDGGSPSHGICQIKLVAAKQVGFKGSASELMNPRTNINYAAKYLKYQYSRYQNWARAVTAYNQGTSTGHGGSAYLAKVFERYVGGATP